MYRCTVYECVCALILEIPMPPNFIGTIHSTSFHNELTRAGTPSARGTAETLEDGAMHPGRLTAGTYSHHS